MLTFKPERLLLNKRINPLLIFIAGLFLLFNVAFGEKFYVAPYGDDDNPGTISKPFATIEKVKDVVWMELDGMGDITVYFRGGTYYINRTILFRTQSSGSENQIITYRNFPGETPVFSSGIKINGWKRIGSQDPGYRYIPPLSRANIYICDVSRKLINSSGFKFLLDQKSDWLPRAKTKSFSIFKKHELDWERPNINRDERMLNELKKVYIKFGWDVEKDNWWYGCAIKCSCDYYERTNKIREEYEKIFGNDGHTEDCLLIKPNFFHKKSGLTVRWYKYPLRDSYSNIPLTYKILRPIIEDCISSIERIK